MPLLPQYIACITTLARHLPLQSEAPELHVSGFVFVERRLDLSSDVRARITVVQRRKHALRKRIGQSG